MLAFPGFEYKTKSIRFIGELEITLTNQTSGEKKYSEKLSAFASNNSSDLDASFGSGTSQN
jgi:hypothetical protein